jgi:FkbM family methyltransferase
MINQIIFNQIIKPSVTGIYLKLLLKIRNLLLLKNPNALIKYTYSSRIELLFPFSHDYPINKKRIPFYSENLGIISRIIKSKYLNAKAIDVGANIGDSAAILNHHSQIPVLCIEGNPKFISILKKNVLQFSNIKVEASFVGEAKEKVNTINYGGTARIEKAESGIEVKTMEEILEHHNDFFDSKLLKIDTDGFDFKVIRASKVLLQQVKPIIFFEFDPFFLIAQNENPVSIFDFLKDQQYNDFLVFDNYGCFVFQINSSQNILLHDLSNYYNNGGISYIDICAIHEIDKDLISSIKKEFQNK